MHSCHNPSVRIMAKLAVMVAISLSFLIPFRGKIYAKDFDLNKAQELFNKAEVLYKENKIDRALEYYFAALDLCPFMPKAYYRIGVIYGPLRRQYRKGIRFFRKSIKYDSQDPNAYHGLGITYCMAGDQRRGSEFLLKAGMMFLRERNIRAALSIYDVLSQTREKDRTEELARAIENRNARVFLSLPPVRSSE